MSDIVLTGSYTTGYPEKFDIALDCISASVVAAFNKCGSMLAVGCNDGRVVIWDFMNRIIIRILAPHVLAVSSISWNRFGDHLCTTSADKTAIIFDLRNDRQVLRQHFNSAVCQVQYRPRNDNHILFCLLKSPPVVLDMTTNELHKLESKIPWNLEEFSLISMQDYQQDTSKYNRSGTHILIGTWKGCVLIMNSDSFEFLKCVRLSNQSSPIRQIEFSRSGLDCCAFVSQDRIIRLYDSESLLKNLDENQDQQNICIKLDPFHKFQDLVNKTVWKKCCFSGDGEYFMAGSLRQCSLYIWDRETGSLLKILHGAPGDVLMDLHWHPYRPIVCSLAGSFVSIWNQPKMENWSAYAPDFKELEENVEYEEKEGEFDLFDEDASPVCNYSETENEPLDLVTVERPIYCTDSDDDEYLQKHLYMIPLALDNSESSETTNMIALSSGINS